MDVTNSDDKSNIFAGLNDGTLFSDDELALLNHSVYSLEPFDSTEIDGILNSYNYGSSHEANSTDFPSSWNDTEIENSSNDFLNGGIDYGNLLSSCIDNTSGPINPANDLLSLDLLHEQPYELILPYEPDQEDQTKTDGNITEFDWDEFMVHSPKLPENTSNTDQKFAIDNSIAVETSPGEMGELQQSLITKFESLKYDEVHQYEFSVDDEEGAAAAAAAASSSKTIGSLGQYHVFLMPLDPQTDYEPSMQVLREKFRKNPSVVGSLVAQSLENGRQSKLIIPFKPKLVDYPNEQMTSDGPNVIENVSAKTKKSRKQTVKLTEPLRTRNEISDVLEALRNAAENQHSNAANAEQTDTASDSLPSIDRKSQKEKSGQKTKKNQEPNMTNFRCSARIQQRRRKSRAQTSTKRHESEKHTACETAKSNQRSAVSN